MILRDKEKILLFQTKPSNLQETDRKEFRHLGHNLKIPGNLEFFFGKT